MRGWCSLTSLLCLLVGVVVSDKGYEKAELKNFQCPLKVPSDAPQPTDKEYKGKADIDTGIGTEGGGFVADFNLNGVTDDFYKQYRAALALVPCDAQALSVYTEPEVNNATNTVSVIFIYDNSIKQLKDWLQEKFYANSYENPIVEKVTEQCPYLIKSLHEPYAKPLTGDEILNILCEEDCTRSAKEKHHKKENECAPVHETMCSIADCSKPGAVDLCPHDCPAVVVTTEPSEVHTPGPIYYKPHPDALAKSKRSASQPQYHPYPTNYQPHYEPVQPHYAPVHTYTPQYHQPVYHHYYENVNFTAPDLIYGTRKRERTISDCDDYDISGDPENSCENLEKKGLIVDCDVKRFRSETNSQCSGSQWSDCVRDDERWLRTNEKSNLYQGCTRVDDSNVIDFEELDSISTNRCFENRRCDNGQVPGDDEVYVGYDAEIKCECKAEPQPTYSQYPATRFKRQGSTGEAFKTNSQQCRVNKSKTQQKIRACDLLQENRGKKYLRQNRIAIMPVSNTNGDLLG